MLVTEGLAVDPQFWISWGGSILFPLLLAVRFVPELYSQIKRSIWPFVPEGSGDENRYRENFAEKATKYV